MNYRSEWGLKKNDFFFKLVNYAHSLKISNYVPFYVLDYYSNSIIMHISILEPNFRFKSVVY